MIQRNILFLIDKSGFGGVQTIARQLIYLNKNSNIYYFFLRNVNRQFDLDNYQDSQVIYSRTTNKYNFWSFFELLKIIKDKNIQVLHLNGDKSTIYGILAKIFYPKIVLIHHEHFAIFFNNWFYNYVLRTNQKSIDLFLAVSKSCRQKLIENAHIKSDKIKVLYNFVDLKKYKLNTDNYQVVMQKYQIPSNKFVIGFVGRLHPVKGCEFLIRALPLLKFNYHLVIAGEGSEHEVLKKLAKNLEVEKFVSFLGYVEDMTAIYDIFDIIVMPSKSEASPMTFFEAQAKGIAVIGSDVSAINEFVLDGQNGLLFEYGNVENLATKINYIYQNPEILEQMKKFALVNIKKYAIENYIRQLKEIYQTI